MDGGQGRAASAVRQYEVESGSRLIARVDLAYPEIRLAVECDGWEHHSGRAAWERDRSRLSLSLERDSS